MENALLDQLKPIFPNLTEEVILLSIRHPSNNTDPAASVQSVFLSCIDDLLQLRTFSLSSAESQKKYLSSDEDESLLKAVEKLEKKERLTANDSNKNNVKETNSIAKKISNTQETKSIVKKIPNTQETNIISKQQTTNSVEAEPGLKPSETTTNPACGGDPKSLSLYQTVRKDVIDSEESSNDSLPDPGLNLDKSTDLSAGKSHLDNPNTQMWSSPLHLCKQKWKVNTGSHSAEVLSKVAEGQRTRYHSEPSEPVFSLNKALNKTGTLIKPAVFSPIKSTDGAVASGLKKATVIKPATFSANKNNNSMSPDPKTASIIRPPKFSPHKDALWFDEKGLVSNKTKPRAANNIIKPGRFPPKPSSSGINSGATDKTLKDSLSSSSGKVFSFGDSNANYKLPAADFPRDEGISVSSTSPLGKPPAGMERWKYFCVEADNGLLDDEQTYRKEILSKSGEVIGKLQDERRKSLVGLSIQKGDIKEVEKASTSGTSIKSASKSLLKTNTHDTCSKPPKSQTLGHSSKADNSEHENISVLRNISKPTVQGLEEKSTYRARSKTGVKEVKKRTKAHVDTDEEENIGIKISASDKEDDELPTFSLLKKSRRQRGDMSERVEVSSLVNIKKKLIDLTRTWQEIPDVRRKGPQNEVLDKDVTVIDITNSSQSSVGSQDNSVINVEALPEFVDITNEQLDVPEDVFEVKAIDRNKDTPEVIVVPQSHEPVLVGNLVDQIRRGTAVTQTVPVKSGVTMTVSQTGGAGVTSTTQKLRPQPAPTSVVTKQPTPATNLPTPAKNLPTSAANLPTSAKNLPPLPTMNRSPEEKLTDMVNEVLMLFPDVDPLYVRNLLLTNIGPESMNNVCNLLLENSNYPRAQKGPSSTVSSDPPPTKQSNKNFYEEYSEPITAAEYRTNCELLLQSEFKMISVKDIRILASYYNWHYAPMHKALSLIVKKGLENIQTQDKGKQSLSQAVIVCDITVGSEKKTVKATCLKCPRFIKCSLSCLPPDLSEEYEFVQERLKEDATDEDMRIAQQINESEYAETGQLIECGCCYCEVAFDNMVQCYEGHLFCSECLMNYANESVFGHGKTSLLCMSDGCDASFPKSQLDKALPANILNKYNDRVQEESINLAALEDLVRCPHCDFAALLDPSVKVFSCQNTSCMKETCRHCKEDWREHFGKRCDEIEKKDEVSLRIKFEEKMAMAKIRTCHRCKAKFMKEEGCNKMTCKCGATMCYVCRKPNIDYKHFCQHLREPKKPCEKCDACFLWSKAEEDDEIAIAEIRKECEAVRMEKGFSLEKMIGAPEEPPSKKLKVK